MATTTEPATHRSDRAPRSTPPTGWTPRRWAVALTGRRDVGEDLAQEALVRTVGEARHDRQPARLPAPAAVVNACRSWQRSANRRRQAERAPPRPASVAGASHELLDSLARPVHTSSVPRSCCGTGRTGPTTRCAALGCRPATVRVLLHRGLAALRKNWRRGDMSSDDVRPIPGDDPIAGTGDPVVARLRTALDQLTDDAEPNSAG